MSGQSILPQAQRQRHPVPIWIYFLGWLLALPLLTGPDTGLALIGMLVVSVLPTLLWRTGEAPTLVWVATYQWFQAFVGIIQAAMVGVSVDNYFGGENFAQSTLLSLLGVLFLAVGMKLGRRAITPSRTEVTTQAFAALRPERLFMVWLVFSLSEGSVDIFLWGSGLAIIVQPIFYTFIAAMLLLFQRTLITRNGRSWSIVMFATQVLVGFVGYFAGFKLAFFVLILAVLTFSDVHRRYWISGACVLAIVVLLGSFWQGIKFEYRQFLNGGEEAQVVRVSIPERVRFISEALQFVEWNTLISGLDEVFNRVGYVTIFGHCVGNVPQNVPHSKGRLWKEAVAHVFMPRLLFPGKMEFNDSDRTNEFSGTRVADASQGTSIGIGYCGESYIDFGIPVMFIPILTFGVLIGIAYGLMVRMAPHPVFGAALGCSLIMRCNIDLASSNAKMLGALVSSLLIYAIILRLAGKPIWRWLCPPAAKSERPRI